MPAQTIGGPRTGIRATRDAKKLLAGPADAVAYFGPNAMHAETNLANIEADLAALVPDLLDLPREEMTLRLEMLVRAYDPCISCSTHLLRVEFV